MSPRLAPINGSHQWEYSDTGQWAWCDCGWPGKTRLAWVAPIASGHAAHAIAAGRYAGTEVVPTADRGTLSTGFFVAVGNISRTPARSRCANRPGKAIPAVEMISAVVNKLRAQARTRGRCLTINGLNLPSRRRRSPRKPAIEHAGSP